MRWYRGGRMIRNGNEPAAGVDARIFTSEFGWGEHDDAHSGTGMCDRLKRGTPRP